MLRSIRQPLTYPGNDLPGFDPSHIAAPNTIISTMPAPPSNINLLTGKPGATAGVPTAVVDGIIGPASVYATTTARTTFTVPTTNWTTITMACIAVFNVITGAAYQGLLSTSSANNGWRLYKSPAATLSIVAAGVLEITGGPSLVANVPYFLGASANASASNFIVVNLLTGQTRITTSTGASSSAGDGTFQVGVDSFSSTPNASIAYAMAANTFMSARAFALWGADPWGFWYPPPNDDFLAAAPSGFIGAPYYYTSFIGRLGGEGASV